MSSWKHISNLKVALARHKSRGGCIYLNQVHLREALKVAGLLDVEDGNDVLMVEISQKLHFTQGTKTEHGVIEWGDFFDRNFLPRRLMERGAAMQMLETALMLRTWAVILTRPLHKRPRQSHPGYHIGRKH